MIWHCDITGNPVGTDTRMIGAGPCGCQGCQADALIRRIRKKAGEAIQPEADQDNIKLFAALCAISDWCCEALSYVSDKCDSEDG